MNEATREAAAKVAQDILDDELGPGGWGLWEGRMDRACAAYIEADPSVCPRRTRWYVRYLCPDDPPCIEPRLAVEFGGEHALVWDQCGLEDAFTAAYFLLLDAAWAAAKARARRFDAIHSALLS